MNIRGGLTTPLFSSIITRRYAINMEKDALKLLVRQLRMLVDALESEVYSDVEAYSKQPEYQAPITDYEEVYDDDGYPD